MATAQPKDNRTAMMQNYEFLVAQGIPKERALEMARGGQSINVNTGSTGIDYGSPEKGLVWERDNNGSVKLDERGAPVAIPYQGGPAYIEQQATEAATANKVQNKDTQGSVVSKQIDKAIDLLGKNGPFDILPEAGIVGGALGKMGLNQEAVDLRNTLSSIQSIVAFDTLQKMREASKTGGALGAVSERELDLLMSAFGAIQQTTSEDLLIENLNTIKTIMGKIEADPIASQFYHSNGEVGTTARPSQQQLSPEARKYLGVE